MAEVIGLDAELAWSLVFAGQGVLAVVREQG